MPRWHLLAERSPRAVSSSESCVRPRTICQTAETATRRFCNSALSKLDIYCLQLSEYARPIETYTFPHDRMLQFISTFLLDIYRILGV